MDSSEPIRWPQHFDPGHAPVFVSNELVVPAPTEAVWACLVNAPRWPDFYSNCSNIALEGGATELSGGTRFRWRTFGVNLRTEVTEFEPVNRIAWLAKGLGVNAYHAWLLTPTSDGGCHILTQETQHGLLARMGKLAMPNRMHRQHQLWLEGMASQAAGQPGI